MAKQLLFDERAREALKHGVDTLTQAVKTTLGPRGRNIALDKKWGTPTVTHDGVTVAKEIELKDPFENMGVQLLKQPCRGSVPPPVHEIEQTLNRSHEWIRCARQLGRFTLFPADYEPCVRIKPEDRAG